MLLHLALSTSGGLEWESKSDVNRKFLQTTNYYQRYILYSSCEFHLVRLSCWVHFGYNALILVWLSNDYVLCPKEISASSNCVAPVFLYRSWLYHQFS